MLYNSNRMNAFILNNSYLVSFKTALLHLDTAVFKFFNQTCAISSLDSFMIAATWLGLGFAQVIASIVLIWMSFSSKRIILRQTSYAVLTAYALSGIFTSVLKQIWQRPRPVLSMFDVRLVDGPLYVNSFPSGHTTTAFACAFAFSAFFPKSGYFLIPLACLTGISRMYLGVHYPLDVFYGSFIGILIGKSAASIVRKYSSAKEIKEQTL